MTVSSFKVYFVLDGSLEKKMKKKDICLTLKTLQCKEFLSIIGEDSLF